jgi:hypothetical protein
MPNTTTNELIKCPKCPKLCNGQVGLKCHTRWQHSSPRARAKMLRASRRNVIHAQRARHLRNGTGVNGPLLIPKSKPVSKVQKRRKKIATLQFSASSTPALIACPVCACNLQAVALAARFPFSHAQ